jgi:hypothetical protein
VQIMWVKGNGKDEFNQRADRLARQSAKAPAEQTIRPARVRRKKSPNKVQVGSVRMERQVLTIRIVVDEFLPAPHKCYRYMYEVMDEESSFYQRVDKITSDVVLSAGHTYSVRVNSDEGNPRIEEMFEEIIEPGSGPDEQEPRVRLARERKMSDWVGTLGVVSQWPPGPPPLGADCGPHARR